MAKTSGPELDAARLHQRYGCWPLQPHSVRGQFLLRALLRSPEATVAILSKIRHASDDLQKELARVEEQLEPPPEHHDATGLERRHLAFLHLRAG